MQSLGRVGSVDTTSLCKKCLGAKGTGARGQLEDTNNHISEDSHCGRGAVYNPLNLAQRIHRVNLNLFKGLEVFYHHC